MDLEVVKLKRPPLWGSCRMTLVILSYFGIFLLMILRFNLSMAVVCMTENKVGEFNWTKETQGEILSSFFYGYIITQIPGGVISDKWGGKFSLLFGMVVLSVGSLLAPALARIHIGLVIAIRIIQGLVSGLAFPSLYNLFSIWSGPEERTTLMSIVFSGISTALIINNPLAGGLCKTGIDGGWPMIFYVPGAIGLIWSLAFAFLAFNSPDVHPRISAEEKSYLKAACSQKSKSFKVPIKSMILSVPVHALWIAHLCHAWGFYLLAVNLPLFGRDVLQLDVVSNGLLTSLPYLGMFCMTITGRGFDFLRQREVLELNILRKIFNSFGFVIPAVCMFSLHFLSATNVAGNVALLIIGMCGHQFGVTGGYYLSHSDLAGPFSGTLFGITNTMAQIPGFTNALLVAHLTPTGSQEEWLSVFDISGFILLFGGLVYSLFGSSELQPWARISGYETTLQQNNDETLDHEQKETVPEANFLPVFQDDVQSRRSSIY